MKIGLVSGLMKDNDVRNQLNVIERYLKENSKCDLLCFGECFLQGSNSLTWDYETDKEIAIDLESETIYYIKELTKNMNVEYHLVSLNHLKGIFIAVIL